MLRNSRQYRGTVHEDHILRRFCRVWPDSIRNRQPCRIHSSLLVSSELLRRAVLEVGKGFPEALSSDMHIAGRRLIRHASDAPRIKTRGPGARIFHVALKLPVARIRGPPARGRAHSHAACTRIRRLTPAPARAPGHTSRMAPPAGRPVLYDLSFREARSARSEPDLAVPPCDSGPSSRNLGWAEAGGGRSSARPAAAAGRSRGGRRRCRQRRQVLAGHSRPVAGEHVGDGGGGEQLDRGRGRHA